MQLSALFPIVLGIILCGVLFMRQGQITRVDEALSFSKDIITKINNLDRLSTEYANRPDKTTWESWRAAHNSLGKNLNARAETTSVPPDMVDRMNTAHDNMYDIFQRLVKSIHERSRIDGASRSTTAKDMILVQRLKEESQNLTAEAFLLAERTHNQTLSIQQSTDFLATATVGVIALVMAAATYFLAGTFSNRLNKIQSGMETVAGGNMSYKIGSHGKDELGELTRSFNSMTSKLAEYENYVKSIELKELEAASAKDTGIQLSKALSKLDDSRKTIQHRERMRPFADMAAGITHDFNNALTSILGNADFALSAKGILDNPEKTKFHLQQIRISAISARDKIERLGHFFHPDNISRSSVDLNSAIGVAIALTQPKWKEQAAARGAQINIEFEKGTSIPIQANEDALIDAITQLVFNSVDSMPEGGTIKVKTEVKERNYIVEISDTGIGMSDEDVTQAFEPFFTTKDTDASGLGLSTVKTIIEAHDGVVDLRSKLGKGTQVFLIIPIRGHEQAPEESGTAVPSLNKALNVLLVDDDEATRSIISRYLSHAGHSVDTSKDGQHGYEQFVSKPYDLVILDRAMPGLNGIELAGKIRAMQPETKIIMLTGFGEVMMDAIDQEVIDMLLGKPITMDELQQNINRLYSSGYAPDVPTAERLGSEQDGKPDFSKTSPDDPTETSTDHSDTHDPDGTGGESGLLSSLADGDKPSGLIPPQGNSKPSGLLPRPPSVDDDTPS